MNLSSGVVTPNGTGCPQPLNQGIYWALNCYAVSLVVLVITLITMLLGFTILTLNSIVFVTILKRKDLENKADILIGSLAMSDMVLGIFLVYQCAYNLGNWQIYGECLVRYGILLGANLTTVFHLQFMTIDRYIKIAHPYLYQRVFKKGFILTVSVCLFTSAFIVGFVPVFYLHPNPPSATETQCAFFLVLTGDYELIYVLLFMMPLIMNAIVYAHIFKIAHRHAKAIADQQTSWGKSGRPSKRSWKFTKTVCILMGFYFTCWMPLGVFVLMDYFGALQYMTFNGKGLVTVYLSVLSYMNSLVNPIIYAVKIPYIKQRFMTLCGCMPFCSRAGTTTEVFSIQENTQASG